MNISGPNKQLSIAYLNTLTFSCIQILLYITIPYISEHTEVKTSTIVASISIGSLIFAFMGPFWAAKSDEWGRKRVITFGMLGMGISFLVLSAIFLFNDLLSLTMKNAMVYLSRIIYGLLVSAIVPVSQAWQLDIIDTKDKMKVLSRNSMCLNIGRILGPILVLIQQVNFEYMIYGGTIWIFVLATACFFISTTEKAPVKSVATTAKIKPPFEWKNLLKESVLPIILALIFTSFIGVLHSTLGHHLKEVLEIRGDEATVLTAKIVLVIGLLALVVLQAGQWVFKRDWKSRLVVGASTLVVGSYLLDAALDINSIWTAVVVIAIGLALIPPVYLSLISHSNAEVNVNGKKIGLASIAHSLGYAVGTGLVAISMKKNLVSNTTVISFISIVTFIIVALLIVNQRNFVMPEKKNAEPNS